MNASINSASGFLPSFRKSLLLSLSFFFWGLTSHGQTNCLPNPTCFGGSTNQVVFKGDFINFGVDNTSTTQRYNFYSKTPDNKTLLVSGPLDGNGGGVSVTPFALSAAQSGTYYVTTYATNDPTCTGSTATFNVYYGTIDWLRITAQMSTTVSFKWSSSGLGPNGPLNYEYKVSTDPFPPPFGSSNSSTKDSSATAALTPGFTNYIHVRVAPIFLNGQEYDPPWRTLRVCQGSTPTGFVSPAAAVICTGGSQLLTASGGTSYQWYYEGSPISGATGATYNATNGGLYTADIKSGGCTANASNDVYVRFGSGSASSCPAFTFSAKVFLQGAYNASTATMSNALNTSGVLQANAAAQPFNTAAFGNYAGTESVGAGFFAAHPDIVDWVLVELRNAATPATIIARKAVFVRQDGALVDVSGTKTQLTFPSIPTGSYHMALRHRNHLGIRTAQPVDFSSGLGGWDFTIAGTQAFQNQAYTSTVPMTNAWVMRGGNANSNNNVKYNGPANDQNQVLNIRLGGSLSQILNGYFLEDVNLNGNVKWNGPANDQNFLLNIILGGSLSAVINEQL